MSTPLSNADPALVANALTAFINQFFPGKAQSTPSIKIPMVKYSSIGSSIERPLKPRDSKYLAMYEERMIKWRSDLDYFLGTYGPPGSIPDETIPSLQRLEEGGTRKVWRPCLPSMVTVTTKVHGANIAFAARLTDGDRVHVGIQRRNGPLEITTDWFGMGGHYERLVGYKELTDEQKALLAQPLAKDKKGRPIKVRLERECSETGGRIGTAARMAYEIFDHKLNLTALGVKRCECSILFFGECYGNKVQKGISYFPPTSTETAVTFFDIALVVNTVGIPSDVMTSLTPEQDEADSDDEDAVPRAAPTIPSEFKVTMPFADRVRVLDTCDLPHLKPLFRGEFKDALSFAETARDGVEDLGLTNGLQLDVAKAEATIAAWREAEANAVRAKETLAHVQLKIQQALVTRGGNVDLSDLNAGNIDDLERVIHAWKTVKAADKARAAFMALNLREGVILTLETDYGNSGNGGGADGSGGYGWPPMEAWAWLKVHPVTRLKYRGIKFMADKWGSVDAACKRRSEAQASQASRTSETLTQAPAQALTAEEKDVLDEFKIDSYLDLEATVENVVSKVGTGSLAAIADKELKEEVYACIIGEVTKDVTLEKTRFTTLCRATRKCIAGRLTEFRARCEQFGQ